MLQLYKYINIVRLKQFAIVHVCTKNSTSGEHEAITNIIESLPLHTKKIVIIIIIPLYNAMLLNHIHKYTLGEYIDTYT